MPRTSVATRLTEGPLPDPVPTTPMKTIARLLAVLVIVLIGVVVLRTLTLSSRQVSASEIDVLPLDEASALARFARSLTFRTVTHQAGVEDEATFRALHEFLRVSFPLVHNALELETIGDLSLLAGHFGEGLVPAGEAMTFDEAMAV